MDEKQDERTENPIIEEKPEIIDELKLAMDEIDKLINEEKFQEAEFKLIEKINLKDNNHFFYSNKLILFKWNLGAREESVKLGLELLKANPTFTSDIYVIFGFVDMEQGNFFDSIRHLAVALFLISLNVPCHFNIQEVKNLTDFLRRKVVNNPKA